MIGYAFRWRMPAPQFSAAWSDVSDFEFVAAVIGPKGANGSAGDQHEETFTASGLWIANHNLGRFVDVTITDLAGNEIGADISRPTVNQVRVSFSTPTAGKVLIR